MILTMLNQLFFCLLIFRYRLHRRFWMLLLLAGDLLSLHFGLSDLLFILPILLHACQVDLGQKEIPDLCCFVLCLFGLYCCHLENLPAAMVIAAASCLPCRAGKLGWGDAKYSAAFSLYAGSRILYSTAAASALCLIYYGIKKGACNDRIPFAPFLSIGFMLVLLFP